MKIASFLMVGLLAAGAGLPAHAAPPAAEKLPTFDELLATPVKLKAELVGKHPRVFVTAQGLETLRERARTTHKAEWQRALAKVPALQGAPPAPPGPQARRAQNNVAFAIVQSALAYQIERDAKYLEAARKWTLAAIDYEPWGYTYNKPNVDLAAGHLLYAIGWAYDLLYDQFKPEERARIRASLERHARLVYDHFSPGPKKRFSFTQNHNFIPTTGLGVAALALMGESKDAEKWATLARAHNQRAGALLSPDGFYYEGIEYWIFSSPWLVHFMDAWEHSTGESLWDRTHFQNWKLYVAHTLLPDGQQVFDFGDVWEGPLTRAGKGGDYQRAYPNGRLESNFNVLYRIASRYKDPEAQAVAERLAGFGHSNLEEWWTLLWRDPAVKPAPMSKLPLRHHFADSGVVMARSSWDANATAFAFRAGPPEGHRVARLLSTLPEWRLDSGHAHPDAGSFIIWAHGRYLVGDTGYSGSPSARQHNTITVGGVGQGNEGKHDVWRDMPYTPEGMGRIRITKANLGASRAEIVAEVAGAYPATAGLERFTRVFTFQAPGRFTIRDTVKTKEPKVVTWYLHADHPLRTDGAKFSLDLGPDAPVRLDGLVRAPAKAVIKAEETKIMAPGAPGSIEKGQLEARGHEIAVEPPAAALQHRFDVTLEVRAQKVAPKGTEARADTP